MVLDPLSSPFLTKSFLSLIEFNPILAEFAYVLIITDQRISVHALCAVVQLGDISIMLGVRQVAADHEE